VSDVLMHRSVISSYCSLQIVLCCLPIILVSSLFNLCLQGANLSDVLMDRSVMNEANLKDAILERAVFTRSDLGGANIEGADFTNALLDKTQQMVSRVHSATYHAALESVCSWEQQAYNCTAGQDAANCIGSPKNVSKGSSSPWDWCFVESS
jgi:hypothetical protein